MMPTHAPTEIIRRASKAFGRLDNVRSRLQNCYELGMPDREGFSGTYQAGNNRRQKVYDSTYQVSWERRANALVAGMVPHGLRWFDIRPNPSIPKDQHDEWQQVLEPYQDALFRYIGASNFYTEIQPVCVDILAGTGAILTEPDTLTGEGVIYTAVPIHELGLTVGAYGRVAEVYRRRKITARYIEVEFEGVEINGTLKRQIDKDPDGELTLLSACLPMDKHFVSYVIHEESRSILRTSMHKSNPYAIARWNLGPGETYGRGPAGALCATAQTLNEVMRLMLMAANRNILGMWTSRDASLNPGSFKLVPGVIIPVDSNDRANPSLSELPAGGNIQWGEFTVNDLRSSIKAGFGVDNLGNVEGPKATAFEILQRQNIVARDDATAYGRMMYELLLPVLVRTAEILAEQGKLPALKLDGELVKVNFVSPLARSQQLDEVAAIQGTLGDVAMMAEFDQTIPAYLKPGDILRELAVKRGTPLSLIEDDQSAQDKIQAAMQQTAAMAGQPVGGGDDGMA